MSAARIYKIFGFLNFYQADYFFRFHAHIFFDEYEYDYDYFFEKNDEYDYEYVKKKGNRLHNRLQIGDDYTSLTGIKNKFAKILI